MANKINAKYLSISTLGEYAEAVERSRKEPVFIYKHSRTCELCWWAKNEILKVIESRGMPVYEVVVQTARPLSNAIEAALGIRHESPQGILLVDEIPVFNASHHGLSSHAIQEVLSSHQ